MNTATADERDAYKFREKSSWITFIFGVCASLIYLVPIMGASLYDVFQSIQHSSSYKWWSLLALATAAATVFSALWLVTVPVYKLTKVWKYIHPAGLTPWVALGLGHFVIGPWALSDAVLTTPADKWRVYHGEVLTGGHAPHPYDPLVADSVVFDPHAAYTLNPIAEVQLDDRTVVFSYEVTVDLDASDHLRQFVSASADSLGIGQPIERQEEAIRRLVFNQAPSLSAELGELVGEVERNNLTGGSPALLLLFDKLARPALETAFAFAGDVQIRGVDVEYVGSQ